MEFVLLLAAKSLIVAGGALLLLKLMAKRSAADRSWIAHLALGSLLLLPVAGFILPSLDVETSVMAPAAAAEPAPTPLPDSIAPATATGSTNVPEAAAAPASNFSEIAASLRQIDWTFWGYALPAAILILLTLAALARLFVLKARATVLVEPHWLTALAHAQKRMGFKHGTALLTSDELPSPISWGVVRPVILLNTAAANSRDEAEAIITHELAHVAGFDWAKLLISRVAVALFWFNPLVWLLAREAHQLREEAADDAVLAADIEDTDYAKLLVGVARHECRGLLIGAHGVAPGKNSLARRIKRVLDTATARAPGGWRWASAAGFFAAGMAVPVAALNLVAPSNGKAPRMIASSVGGGDMATVEAMTAEAVEIAAEAGAEAAEGASIVGNVMLTSPSGASIKKVDGKTEIRNVDGSTIRTANGKTEIRNAEGATVTVYAADAHGKRRVVLRSPSGAIVEYPDARAVPGLANLSHSISGRHAAKSRSMADQAIEMKALGISPEYVAGLRKAAPHLGNLDSDDLAELKAVGVTPQYIRDLTAAGVRRFDKDQLVDARAVGVSGDYVRSLANAGFRGSLEDYVEMRAVQVTPRDVSAAAWSGGRLDADRVIDTKTGNADPPEPPATP